MLFIGHCIVAVLDLLHVCSDYISSSVVYKYLLMVLFNNGYITIISGINEVSMH